MGAQFDEYLLIIWRGKPWVLGCTAVAVILALLFTWMSPSMYEASVTLMISPSRIGEQVVVPTSVRSFEALIRTRIVAAEVLGEFGLLDPPHSLDAALFVEEQFQVRQIRDTNLLHASVRLSDAELAAQVANRLATRAVEFYEAINRRDTNAARDFIQNQLDQAKERLAALDEQLIGVKRASRIELLEQQVEGLLWRISQLNVQQGEIEEALARQAHDAAPQRLTEARQALLDYQRTSQLARDEQLLAAKLAEGAALETKATTMAIDLESERARLRQAEVEIGSQERVIALTRSIDNDPALMEQARRGRDQNGSLLALSLLNEVLNPTFQVLEGAIVRSRTNIAAFEHGSSEILARLDSNADELEKLQADVAEKRAEMKRLEKDFELSQGEYLRLVETSPSGNASALAVVSAAREEALDELSNIQRNLYERQIRLANLEIEHQIARDGYMTLANEYEQARVRIASRSAELQVVDPALAPLDPVSPRPLLNLLIALVVGGMLGILAAVLVVRVDEI